MPTNLSQILPIDAYLGRRDINWEANRQDELSNINTLSGLLQLQNMKQAQAREAAFRSGLKPGMTQEELTRHASQFASPSEVLKTQQSSLDRQEAIKARALQYSMILDTRQQELDRKRDEFAQRTQDVAANRVFNEWYKTQTLQNQQAQNQINNSLKAMGLEITRQGQQIQIQKLEQVVTQIANRNVQQLGVALERANLPEADAVLKGVENALSANPDLASYISGPKSILPDITPGLQDSVRAGRQAFQKLFNITLKNRSGAAVTIPEFERLKQEFATGVWKKPEQLVEGVRQARDIIQNHYRSVASGFGPEVLKAYNENARQFGGSAILEAEEKPEVPSAPKKRLRFDNQGNRIP